MARTPFYGRNDTKIAKMDMQAATAPGRAYASAFQKLGDIASDTLEKFREKKEEKEQQELSKNQIVNLYKGNPDHPVFKALDVQSIDEAKAVAGDFSKQPELLTQAMSFAKAVTDKKKAQEASQLRNLQMDQIRRNMENADADRLRADQNRMSENQFMQSLMSQTASPQAQRQADIARPGLAALGNGDARNRFMQAQLQQPQNQVPVSSLGSQDFGRFASREGLDPKLSVARMEALRQAELASQPKAPTPFEAKKYFDESINKMRKEYNSLDEVKAFKPVRAAFLKVKQSAEKPSAAGDLALVFNYMKILDPGSVVREGEFKTAADATAWLQKSEANGVAIPAPIAQAIRKLKDGTILTDAQRKDFVNIARKAASAQFAPVKDSYLQYRNIVNQMQLPEGLTLPDNYQMIEDELAGPISIESSSNAITTDQGNYTIPGLSVEAQ